MFVCRSISLQLLAHASCLITIGLMVTFSASASWSITWIDRFEGDSVNWDNWTAQTQANYNNEVQCYTDDDASASRNYEVSDGTLKIIARKGEVECVGLGNEKRAWTSGRLNSKDKAEFLYGRLETRLRFNQLKGGTWPAFWMLEHRIDEQPVKGDNDTIGWPNPGAAEIDVWEWYSNQGDRYITNFFNTHRNRYFSDSKCGTEYRVAYPNGAIDVTQFNVYAIEWTADVIEFFMNDTMVAKYDMTQCDNYEQPMFVLLNVAMGGTLGGDIDPTLTSAILEVDYVAHCRVVDEGGSDQCNEQTPLVRE